MTSEVFNAKEALQLGFLSNCGAAGSACPSLAQVWKRAHCWHNVLLETPPCPSPN